MARLREMIEQARAEKRAQDDQALKTFAQSLEHALGADLANELDYALTMADGSAKAEFCLAGLEWSITRAGTNFGDMWRITWGDDHLASRSVWDLTLRSELLLLLGDELDREFEPPF